MRRPRFTIRRMMVAVAVAAFGFAVLRYPTPFGGSLVFSLVCCALLFAIPCAIYRRGRARAFWIGFAVFGCGHLLWASVGSENHRGLGPVPLTAIFALIISIYFREDRISLGDSLNRFFAGTSDSYGESLYLILYSIMTLFVAFLGGLVVARVFGRDDPGSSDH